MWLNLRGLHKRRIPLDRKLPSSVVPIRSVTITLVSFPRSSPQALTRSLPGSAGLPPSSASHWVQPAGAQQLRGRRLAYLFLWVPVVQATALLVFIKDDSSCWAGLASRTRSIHQPTPESLVGTLVLHQPWRCPSLAHTLYCHFTSSPNHSIGVCHLVSAGILMTRSSWLIFLLVS